MEDYWQNKLDDERKFYEGLLKTNERQFKDLENRMKEYDEVLASIDKTKDDESDALSTIEETSSLEYQVKQFFLFFFFVINGFICRLMNGKKKYVNLT